LPRDPRAQVVPLGAGGARRQPRRDRAPLHPQRPHPPAGREVAGDNGDVGTADLRLLRGSGLLGGGGEPGTAQPRPLSTRTPELSLRAIAAAMEAFGDSVRPPIGIETTWWLISRARRDRPLR